MPWASYTAALDALRRSGRRRVLTSIPQVPGQCMIGRCRRDAVADPDEDEPVLCIPHKIVLRPSCMLCGRKLTDKVVRRGLCGRCWYAVPDGERPRHTELAARQRAMAEYTLARDLRAQRAPRKAP